RTLTIVVSNSNTGGAVPTSGTVAVTDTLPPRFTATSIIGTGWSCTTLPLKCTRTDVLATGASYPAITLTVSVGNDAISASNRATVSGGGDVNTANNTATDTVTITPAADPVVSQAHPNGLYRGQ